MRSNLAQWQQPPQHWEQEGGSGGGRVGPNVIQFQLGNHRIELGSQHYKVRRHWTIFDQTPPHPLPKYKAHQTKRRIMQNKTVL